MKDKKILEYIRKEGRITTTICAELISVSSDTALREMSRLKSIKLIKQQRVGKAIFYVIA